MRIQRKRNKKLKGGTFEREAERVVERHQKREIERKKVE